MIVNLALAAKVHTRIVQALVTSTHPDPLATIAASHEISTRLGGVKNQVAPLAIVGWVGVKVYAEQRHVITSRTINIVRELDLHFLVGVLLMPLLTAKLRTARYNRANTIWGAGRIGSFGSNKPCRLSQSTYEPCKDS
jgi:hypothetical protein